MMRIPGAFVTVAFAMSWYGCSVAHGAIAGLQRVASGVSAPMFATHAPGDTSRLFIAERGGAIRILNLNTGVLQATPFLSMSGISTDGEGGFLGLAFHPNYSNVGMTGYGKFYVNVTTNFTTETHIREFEVSAGNPNLADSGSLREILSFAQPQANHNGGWIGFSPNHNYLYIASGDGGGGNDTGTGHSSGGNAQDITNNLLGKVLRIDPTGDDFPDDSGRNYSIPPTNPFKAGVGIPGDDGGDDEIWAFGLRNPFRASFDRIIGDLWIGDVGQDNREEIDFQSASSTGGTNYGWRLREGDIATPGVGGSCASCVEPVYSYTHSDTTVPPVSPAEFSGNLVTGGYAYRGPDPSLQGKYFFLDAAGNNHWMANTNPFGSVTNIDSLLTPDTGSASFAVSFGEDAVGNLYIVYNGSGEVYRISTNQLLRGDFNADGSVDADDYAKWRAGFGGANLNPASDGNGNGVFDAADFVAWRNNFGASVHTGAASGEAVVPEPVTAAIIGASLVLLPALLRCRRPLIIQVNSP